MPTDKDKIRDALTISEAVERWLTSEDIERKELARLLHGSNKLLKEIIDEEK